jgi:hypothetical protein
MGRHDIYVLICESYDIQHNCAIICLGSDRYGRMEPWRSAMLRKNEAGGGQLTKIDRLRKFKFKHKEKKRSNKTRSKWTTKLADREKNKHLAGLISHTHPVQTSNSPQMIHYSMPVSRGALIGESTICSWSSSLLLETINSWIGGERELCIGEI